MHGARKVLALASDIRWWLTASLAARFAQAATYLAQAFLLAAVLQRLLSGDGVSSQRSRLAAIGALIAARFVLVWAVELIAAATAAATKRRVRDRALAKLADLGPGYVAGEQSGAIRATVVESVEALEHYYGQFAPSVVTAVAVPAACVVILALRDGWLALLLALIAVGTVALPPLWSRPLASQGSQRMSAYIALGSEFLDTLQGLVTLKAFGAAGRRRAQLAAASSRLTTQWIREMRIVLVPGGIYALGVTGGFAAVVAVAAYRVAGGGLALGTLFLTLFLAREALRPIGVLATAFHASYEAVSGAQRLEDLFAAKPAVPSVPPVTASQRATGELTASVRFENVTFTYPGGTRPALAEFDLDLRPGTTTAIVGPSGAGKSTVAALLLRFAGPQHGAVLLGGTDVRDLTDAELYGMVSLVAQDTYLFSGTVRDNLAMARPDATDEQISAAARVADAHGFITALPAGYDTEIGERGLRLSGGQRQRLALARAVLAARPVLILDEATASVDAATEAAITQALDRVTAGRTTLVIAHRLSTVRNADRIVVLDQGRIAESGHHADLLTRAGSYARLVSAQEAS